MTSTLVQTVALAVTLAPAAPSEPEGAPDAEPSLVVADADQCEDALIVDEVVVCDDALAQDVGEPAEDSTDTPTAAEIIAQTGADVRWEPAPARRWMSREGVIDPFPDRAPRARPRDAAILLGVGVGFAVGGVLAARSTLMPDCRDMDDLNTCAVPNAASIGLRSGRLFGTIGFAVGSAAFGAFGTRELGQVLREGRRWSLPRRRRLALGLGGGATTVGVAGLAVGAGLLARGARRSVALADSLGGTVDLGDPADSGTVDAALAEVRVARTGLMVMVASPILVAGGISLLVHRPRRVSVTPVASRHELGVQATVRF